MGGLNQKNQYRRYEFYSNRGQGNITNHSIKYREFKIIGELDLHKLVVRDDIKNSDIKKLYAPSNINIDQITAVYHDKNSLFHFTIDSKGDEKTQTLGILIKKSESDVDLDKAQSKLEKFLNVKLKNIEQNQNGKSREEDSRK